MLYARKEVSRRQTAELLLAEKRLAESERRYRTVLEKARMIAVGLDGEGRINFVNPYLLEVTGYSPDELAGRNWFEVFPPPPIKGEENLSGILETELSPRNENRILTKSGEERLISWNNIFLDDPRGGKAGTISLGEDVTERKRAEEALRASEEAARRAAEHNAVIGEIGRIVSSSLDIDSVYEQFAQTARKLIDFDRISINMIGREKDFLTIAYSWGTAVEGRHSGERIPFAGSGTERVFESRRSLFIQTEDGGELARELPSYFPNFAVGLRSALFVPLISREEVIGSLSFLSLRPGAYTDRDREVGEQIGLQIAGAIASAQLYLERQRAEERVRASLREKEVLLKEVHHRVKNNLQVISSLLNLQSRSLRDPGAVEVFRESQNRVRSLALVHERLYRSADLARVDFGEYLRNLVSSLFASYSPLVRGGVGYEIDAGETFLGVDLAIPCGLVVNELVSNALKHAFPGGRQGKILISFQRSDGGPYMLRVKDDGVGLPPGLDLANTETLGFQLVHTLTEQLAGTLEWKGEGGTEFTLTFEGRETGKER